MSVEKFLQTIQPCDKDNPVSVALAKRWFWQLGRIVKTSGLSAKANDSYFEAAIKNAAVIDDNLREELYTACTRGYRLAKLPPQALEQIAKAVEAFINSWGEIATPRWCVVGAKSKYPRLYLAIHILGLNGKTFPFAQNAVAQAFGFSPGTVRNFIRTAIADGYLDVVRLGTSRNPSLLKGDRKDERCGKPSYFRLRCEDRFGNIRRIAHKNDAISFEEFLKRTMEWLFYRGENPSLND